jgi:hypothetical protein
MDALSNLILRGSLDKLSAFLAEKLLVAYDKTACSLWTVQSEDGCFERLWFDKLFDIIDQI